MSNPYLNATGAVDKMVLKLQAQKPPTARPTDQITAPGMLILDYCQVLSVNTTGAVVGSGATALAPYTCSISYQNTTIYGVQWIGAPPIVGFNIALVQQPLFFVLGLPSKGISSASWASNSRVHIVNAQNLGAAGFTKVALDTADFDVTTMWDLTTNHRCTPKTAGLYQVNFALGATLENNPESFFSCIYKNGALVSEGTRLTQAGGTAGDLWGSTGADLIRFNGSTDYIELWGYSGGGNAEAVSGGGSVTTYVSCAWMAP